MRPELIIVEPYFFISYKEIEIQQCINEHGTAEIKGILDKETDEDILEKMSPNETITIKAVLDNGESQVLFKGLVRKAELIVEDGIKILEINAISHTLLMDMKRNIRIFQDTEQLYSDIAKYIASEHKARIICTEGEERKTGHMIAQYNETDWEFLKRLASELNTIIVADSVNGKISFSFGPPKPKKRILQDFSYKTTRNLGEFYRQKSQGREECREQDVVSVIVTTRELVELCSPVEIEEEGYLVKKFTMKLVGAEMVNTCELVYSGGLKTTRFFNSRISGISISGMIHQVKRDIVQIRFPQDINGPYVWFPYVTAYSSPDGTGWYCMPEIGDTVRAYFPDEDESHGVAVNMVHLTCGLREQPDIKFIRSPYEKEIRFEPSAIYITNHKGMSVVLDDKRGISIKSDSDIVVMAEGDINMHSGRTMKVIGEEGVVASQGDNRIEIKDGIKQTARVIAQK